MARAATPPPASLVDRLAERLVPAVIDRVMDRVVAGVEERLGAAFGLGAPTPANDERPKPRRPKKRRKAAAERKAPKPPPKAKPPVEEPKKANGRPPSAQTQRLIRLMRSGRSPSAAAAEVGCSTSNAQRVKRKFVSTDGEDESPAPAPAEPKRLVRRHVRGAGGGPGPSSARMVELARNGASVEEIALETGRHKKTVRDSLARWAPDLVPFQRPRGRPRGVRRGSARGHADVVGRGEDSGLDHAGTSRAQVDDAIERMDAAMASYDIDGELGFTPCRDDRCANDDIHPARSAECRHGGRPSNRLQLVAESAERARRVTAAQDATVSTVT